MKQIIISKCMNLIKKYQHYDDIKLEEIEYGLTAIYLTFSKLIVISIIALFLGIFKEMIIFLLIYNILRVPSFGLHATKSWICLVTSTIFFIGIPIICININLYMVFKITIGIFCSLLMFKNSPADTKKRPIVSKKRRLFYKIVSTVMACLFTVISITIKNNFLSNCFIFALILQNILIAPLTYKIFRQPYNNYKEFLRLNPNFFN